MNLSSNRSGCSKIIRILICAVILIMANIACSAQDGTTAPDDGEPLILANGTIATPTSQPIANQPSDVPDGLGIVWEAYSILMKEYVARNEIDPDTLAEAAVVGMLDALNDRYTSYVRPETFQIDQASFQGKFFGIGAQVEPAPDLNGVIITRPLPDSPAEAAGIKAGDRILAVDGVDALEWSVIEAVNKIRGEEGTEVVLTVEHVGSLDPVDITIVRGEIPEISVTTNMISDTNYGRVRIDTFTAETVNEMRKGLDELIEQGAKGIVLDLRGNPGGLLSATVDVASEFLTDGLVTYEVNSRGERKNWEVKQGGNYPDIPVVTLVDNFSASGSEVLTGALQDQGRSVVIGTSTFGKGSVNLLRGLSNGGGVYLTIGRWYTPNGRLIEEVGVEPDVVVEFDRESGTGLNSQTAAGGDPQIDAAVKQLDFQISQLR